MHLYSKLPDIRALARTYIPMAYNRVRPVLWDYKERILGGVAMSGLAWMAIRYYMNRPKYPIASLNSSLNKATLSIETLKSEVVPPNVTLTFCVDTSGSMQGEREEAVKRGVNRVLTSALRVIETINGAQIGIAIIGFSRSAYTICEPTQINSSNIDEIRRNLNEYRSNGGTKIINGLKEATTRVEGMARSNKNAGHTLILLSDGDEKLSQSKVDAIHTRLIAAKVRLFAIGIGEGHDKATLKKIAPESGRFRGTYIDTTLRGKTIEGAIATIYEQAVAVFSSLVLSTAQLAAGTWSVDNVFSVRANKRSACQLGSFTEERGIVKTVQIHADRLREPVDLSGVSFKLAFTDPQGRKGTMSLPWNPGPIMDPKILNRV